MRSMRRLGSRVLFGFVLSTFFAFRIRAFQASSAPGSIFQHQQSRLIDPLFASKKAATCGNGGLSGRHLSLHAAARSSENSRVPLEPKLFPWQWQISPANGTSTLQAASATVSANGDTNETEKPTENQTKISSTCRVVTLSDGVIPIDQDALPSGLFESPQILNKLDKIYHAISHEQLRALDYTDSYTNDDEGIEYIDEKEEEKLASTVRKSLEDAGFQLLSQRDLDLCEALNVGYLLSLSIAPETKDLDPNLVRELYPELFQNIGEATLVDGLSSAQRDPMLFEGKVLIYWRGYSEEVSEGRLILPKIDFLQANLVQSAAAALKERLNTFEDWVVDSTRRNFRSILANSIRAIRGTADGISVPAISGPLRKLARQFRLRGPAKTPPQGGVFFNLNRYGASRTPGEDATNALRPFLVYGQDAEDLCSMDEVIKPINAKDASKLSLKDDDVYNCLNHNDLRCPYDQKMQGDLPPMQLLRRVSVGDVVNFSSREKRKAILRSLFQRTELAEPTYKEVVVIWRPQPPKPRPKLQLPQFVYDVADLFDIEGDLIKPPKIEEDTKPKPLEIRTFDGTPLANLPAVFPKTKLKFRPADAIVFDFVSIVSVLLALGSQKFDSPKLDLLALVSVLLSAFRVFIRYSNKLARYDLLVKTFLTTKIANRNGGALKYLVGEAGSQRATRAALVHNWLQSLPADELQLESVLKVGPSKVNDLVEGKQVQIDMQAALADLEDIKLISIRSDTGKITVSQSEQDLLKWLNKAWIDIFREK